MKKSTLIIVLLFVINISYAQEAKQDSSSGNHYIGLNVGSSTGLGFSYKYVKNRLGLQLSGIPVYRDGDLWASAGAGLTYRSKKAIITNKKFIPLLYAGTSIVVGSEREAIYLQYFSTAVGFGFDHKFAENFTFSLMGGYGVYVTGSISTTLSAEMGIHYRL